MEPIFNSAYKPINFMGGYDETSNAIIVSFTFNDFIQPYVYLTLYGSTDKSNWVLSNVVVEGNGPSGSITTSTYSIPLLPATEEWYPYYKIKIRTQSYYLTNGDLSSPSEQFIYWESDSTDGYIVVEVPEPEAEPDPDPTFDIDGILEITVRDNTKDTFNLDFHWTRGSSNPPLKSFDVYLCSADNPHNLNEEDSTHIYNITCDAIYDYADAIEYENVFTSEQFNELITNVNYGDYVQLIMKTYGENENGSFVGTAKSTLVRRYKGLPTKVFYRGQWVDADVRIYNKGSWKFINNSKQYQ